MRRVDDTHITVYQIVFWSHQSKYTNGIPSPLELVLDRILVFDIAETTQNDIVARVQMASQRFLTTAWRC